MKLAELIAADARERGLRHFFGIPSGGASLDVVDAGGRMGVDFVSVAHESTAAIAAGYYGLARNTAGLALAIKGVGAGNLVGGAVNAHFERLPVVCLCESPPSQATRQGLVQYCEHSGLFGAVAKSAAVLEPSQAPATVQEAAFRAADGRPGPVLLDLPADLGQAEVDGPLPPRSAPYAGPPDPSELEAARTFLRKARRPAVIAGADVARAGATEELQAVVEAIGGAVLVNMDARGVLSEAHPRWAGVLLGGFDPNTIEPEILDQADAALLVGADAMMSHVGWPLDLPTCELVLRPEYETLSPAPRVRVNGDLKATLRALLEVEQEGFTEGQVEAMRLKILRRNFARPGQARFAAQDIIEIARDRMPTDGVLVSETGIFVCMLEHMWPIRKYGQYLGTSGGRTMGLMVPAMLGAKLAQPEVPMLGIGADGSTLMRLGELEVFARTGLAVPLVIVNDGALGTIKGRQKLRGLSDYGLDLHPVDLAGVAVACGLNGVTVDTPERFEAELKTAMEAHRTTLIDARVDPQPYQDNFGPTVGVVG